MRRVIVVPILVAIFDDNDRDKDNDNDGGSGDDYGFAWGVLPSSFD